MPRAPLESTIEIAASDSNSQKIIKSVNSLRRENLGAPRHGVGNQLSLLFHVLLDLKTENRPKKSLSFHVFLDL